MYVHVSFDDEGLLTFIEINPLDVSTQPPALNCCNFRLLLYRVCGNVISDTPVIALLNEANKVSVQN